MDGNDYRVTIQCEVMLCQNCGAENLDGAAFCNDCGMALVPDSIQSTIISKRKKDVSAPKNQKREKLQIDLVSGSTSTPVPATNKNGFFLFVMICIGLAVVVGIGLPLIVTLFHSTQTTDISKVAAVPTVTVAPTRALIQGQDPIIGTWHGNAIGQSKTIFYTFTSDGHYSNTDSISDFTEGGTWIKGSENRYFVTVHYQNISFIYQPETDTIAKADYPELRFYPPGKGSAIITPTPTPPPTTKTTYQSVYSSSGSSSSGSGNSHAGQCYVNGYYRKSGTYVNGYWRSC